MGILVLLGTLVGIGPATGAAEAASPPFAAVQYGTNGCIEVGARPDPPYNQPRPFAVPDGTDLTAGYPAYGYDPAGYTQTSGTNSCRYNFRDNDGNVIGSGYCVQWGAGQRSGTGYDPRPTLGRIADAGYVRRILANYWPATSAPAVPSANPTVANRQRSGTVAMAIHYFTDGIVLPPNYQDRALYDVVRTIVTEALAVGPMPEQPNPTPEIDGPLIATAGVLAGPFTIGANATGPVTAVVTGADAYTDAAGTVAFASGSTLPPGGRLWLRAAAGPAEISVTGPVVAQIGTLMVPDPAHPVQQMMLAQALTLESEAARVVQVRPPAEPVRLRSRVSAAEVTVGAQVGDTVFASGLADGGSIVVTPTLYGPLDPVGGGCGGVDWTGPVPVGHVYPSVDLTGNGATDLPPQTVTSPGCYSFGLVGVPGDVTVPPGDPLETVLVKPDVPPPPYQVATTASAAKVAVGALVSDHVTVTGLAPGATLTVATTLYGPLIPATPGDCTTANWRAEGIPVAATLPPVTVTGDGAYDSATATVRRPGCYSFAAVTTTELVTGGEVPAPQGLGAPAELVLVTGAEPTTQPSPGQSQGPGPGPLPVTSGPHTPYLAGLGLLLLLLGLLLGTAPLLATRRRRPPPPPRR
ncbi:thioester domain-containing protein [Hamadaea tsunoensis]|uniref:thioester domain-containing protein n=1 Tax=Hamadaea tsunoensis TaxID=53368 RepID=UPI0012F9B1BE|nr:thioester domain-containing protein [Hamadaea tsunoensis]